MVAETFAIAARDVLEKCRSVLAAGLSVPLRNSLGQHTWCVAGELEILYVSLRSPCDSAANPGRMAVSGLCMGDPVTLAQLFAACCGPG